MNTEKQSRFTFPLLAVLLVSSFLTSACSLAALFTSAPNTIREPESTALPGTDASLHFSLDTGSLATGFQTETIAAVSVSDNAPYWEKLPEYTLVTLQGYPISSHLMRPQIFIYPAEELRHFNEATSSQAFSLQFLLENPQEIERMPFMPLLNASQMMHAHVQFLDFKDGQGLRYLTEFAQGIVPINNNELIYTYQGLTRDGKYYVAAVLPVNHSGLPADGNVTGNEPPEFYSDFPVYLANVVMFLNPQPANSFTPDLTQLDAMMSSLEVK
jgi:hypothetical protein